MAPPTTAAAARILLSVSLPEAELVLARVLLVMGIAVEAACVATPPPRSARKLPIPKRLKGGAAQWLP